MSILRDQLHALIERTDAPPADVLADLEALKAVVWSKLIAPPTPATVAAPEARLVAAARMAELLDVPEHWVRDNARRKRIPSIKVGHYVLFDPVEVIAAVKALNGSHKIGHPVHGEKRNTRAGRVHQVSTDTT